MKEKKEDRKERPRKVKKIHIRGGNQTLLVPLQPGEVKRDKP